MEEYYWHSIDTDTQFVQSLHVSDVFLLQNLCWKLSKMEKRAKIAGKKKGNRENDRKCPKFGISSKLYRVSGIKPKQPTTVERLDA